VAEEEEDSLVAEVVLVDTVVEATLETEKEAVVVILQKEETEGQMVLHLLAEESTEKNAIQEKVEIEVEDQKKDTKIVS
jgi:hypothetical protein